MFIMFILCRFNLAYTVYVFNLYIKQGEKSKQYSTFNQSSVNINLKFVKALVGLSFTSLKNTSGKFRFKLGRIKPWNYLHGIFQAGRKLPDRFVLDYHCHGQIPQYFNVSIPSYEIIYY